MVKIIDLKEEAKKKQIRVHTLEHFIQTEFTRENQDISVKIEKYRYELLNAKIIAGKGRSAEDVIKLNFDGDIGDVRIESMEVLDRLYQYLAIRVAEKYEEQFKRGEVTIYLNKRD